MRGYPKFFIGLGWLTLGVLFLLPVRVSAQSVTVKVPANVAWTDTGVSVDKGQVVEFRVTGTWSFDPGGSGMHGPEGARGVEKAGAGFPLPNQPPGRLLAKVGNWIHPIDAHTELKMAQSGQLFLGINDSGLNDNQGVLTVTLTAKAGRKLKSEAGPTPSTPGTAPPTTGQSITVTVPANVAWTDTGLTVTSGQTLQFQASGTWSFDPQGSGMHGPDGVTATGRAGGNFPLPTQPPGQLLAKIGNQIRPVGSYSLLTMPGSGPLFLGINDAGVGDNQGVLTVTITSPSGSILRQGTGPTSPAPREVIFRVLDPNNQPVSNYWVSIHTPQSLGDQRVGKVLTDSQGYAALPLADGTYTAYVYPGNESPALTQDFSVPTNEGSGNTLTLVVPAPGSKQSAKATSQVTAPGALNPASPAPAQTTQTMTVHLQDQSQRPLAGYQISIYALPGGQKVGEGQTDPQGNFTIALPNGEYRATLSYGGRQIKTGQFEVPPRRGGNQFTITLRERETRMRR